MLPLDKPQTPGRKTLTQKLIVWFHSCELSRKSKSFWNEINSSCLGLEVQINCRWVQGTFWVLFVCFCGTEFWPQGLVLARQELYHLRHTCNPELFEIVYINVLKCSKIWWWSWLYRFAKNHWTAPCKT
jgi:hypothetical protein